MKLDAARREHEDAAMELRKLEPAIESRDADRMARKPDGASAAIG